VSNVDGDLDAILTALRRADPTTARARQPDLDASSEMVAEGISRAIDINVAAAATRAADIRRRAGAQVEWPTTSARH
jgi:hypothetical protein